MKDPAQISKEFRDRVDIVAGEVFNVVDVHTTLRGQDAAVVVIDNVGEF